MENSINRNRVTHIHEVVENLVHWFDDKIFRLYPTWEDCVMGGIFTTHQLEQFFGPYDGTKVGQTNYKQCAERGIGRRIIAKMLIGTATVDEIRKTRHGMIVSGRGFSPVLI